MCWVDTTLHSSGPITVSKRVTVHVSMCRGIVARYICRVYGTGLLPLNSDPLSQSLASNLMSVEQHSCGEEDLAILRQWKWIIWLQRKTNAALKMTGECSEWFTRDMLIFDENTDYDWEQRPGGLRGPPQHPHPPPRHHGAPRNHLLHLNKYMVDS